MSEHYVCISYNPNTCTKQCEVSTLTDVDECLHMFTYGNVFWEQVIE